MPEIKRPLEVAAGPLAVAKSLQKVMSAMPASRAFKVLKHLNQHDGIDCPGCAWPDPKTRSKLGEFCENGVKAIAEEAMSGDVGKDFFEKHSISALNDQSDYWLGLQGRLSEPVFKAPNEDYYRAISWKSAYDLIGQHLRKLPSPDEAIFYTSGRTSNEAAFLYQLFVRKLGTNNLPDCSNMCHESSGVALGETLGIGKGSVTLEDFDKTQLILIFGQNPGTNHPRMLSALEKAKKNGTKVIVINPLREAGLLKFDNPQKVSGWINAGTDIADFYLQVKINEDVALLKAWLKLLLKKGAEQPNCLDQSFIVEKTEGYDALVADLNTYELTALIERTGLSVQEVLQTAELIDSSERIIACWAMGMTQHVNAVDNIREIVNLLLLKGSIGKPGAGTCPVRGHSNVQGDRTMGIYERPTKAWTDKLRDAFGFNPPEMPGYNVVEAIEAMHQGKAGFFMSLGGNFLPAAPDTHYTRAALMHCDMTVHVSTKLNRTHLAPGKSSLILPCVGRTDQHLQQSGPQFVTVENSMGIVHASHGMLTPRGDIKTEPEIIAQIAHRSLPGDQIQWLGLVDNYDNIRALIAKAISGFEDYTQRVRKENGFELPNGARKGIFETPTGKAGFTINAMSEGLMEGHRYVMMTIRSHDQFNTTIYGLDDRYRGVFGQRMVVFMNTEDMRAEGLLAGDKVTLKNHYKTIRSVVDFVVVPYQIPLGCLATYFPEANPLVPLRLTARKSHTPSSKSVCVNIEKQV
jgi:molybdopterin-dependent oxidoreductase alpha subunit